MSRSMRVFACAVGVGVVSVLGGCGDDDTASEASAPTSGVEPTTNGPDEGTRATTTESIAPVDPDPQHEATEAGLQAAAQDSYERYLSDPAGTWAYLTAVCQARWRSAEAWAANVERGIDQLAGLTGKDIRAGSIGEVEVVKFAGTTGETYAELLDAAGAPIFTAAEALEDTQPWVHEGGGWRTTECEPVTDPNEPAPE